MTVEEARAEWAIALARVRSREQCIREVRQMMIDAMAALEQSGIDAALCAACEAFDARVGCDGGA